MSQSIEPYPVAGGQNFVVKARLFMPVLVGHIKSHAISWLLLACLYLVVHANYRLAINQTPSLPYKLFLIHIDEKVVTGGLVAFRTHNVKPYPDGYVFVKRVAASSGDNVEKAGRNFIAGGKTLVGKEVGLSKKILFPNDQLREGKNTLPPNKYFVAGDHEYSLDSRYSLLGLVDEKDVIGRAYPIF
jgi:conjugal transfer pilin signal peptidase TrbI